MRARSRLFIVLGLFATAWTVACTSAPPETSGTPASAVQEADRDWAMPNKNMSATRYSGLNEINTENVSNLKVAWTFSTGVLRGHEGNPLVVGDTMYVHTPFPNIVYALDLTKEGAPVKWKYAPRQDPNVIPVACCDTVNRGLAYADGKLFLNQLDTTTVSLDAAGARPVLRDEFGNRTVHDVVSGERDKIMDLMRDKANEDAGKIGVQVLDVRLKRVDLPQEVSESVYRRMEAERKRIANERRSTGAAEAEKIRASADRQREVILAEAYRDAQRVRGEGDARSAAIYAAAFNQNPEFYSFYRSMEAYRSTFRGRNDLMLLETNSDFLRYFRDSLGKPARK